MTVALAHLASLAANLRVQLANRDAVPFLYHVADLQLPQDGTKDPLTILINAASERAPIFDLGRLPQFIQQTFKNGNKFWAVRFSGGFKTKHEGEI